MLDSGEIVQGECELYHLQQAGSRKKVYLTLAKHEEMGLILGEYQANNDETAEQLREKLGDTSTSTSELQKIKVHSWYNRDQSPKAPIVITDL